MKGNFLARNIDALRINQPDLAQRVDALSPQKGMDVFPSRTGEPTAQILQPDGSSKLIHSRRDPRRDAEQWVGQMDLPTPKAIALMGLGLGYPLEGIYRRFAGFNKPIWCFEASLELFREMLTWKDWTVILSNPKVVFFVEVDQNGFRQMASGAFQQVIIDGLEILEYSPSVQIDPDWHARHKENLRDLIRMWTSEMITLIEMGPLFQTNTLRNFTRLASSCLFRDAGSVLKGRPAIMVSAGPSLDKNATQLARAKGKIPIVSVDTSLRILQKHGITPDLAVSIDPLGMSVKHFEGVSHLEKLPLLYDLEVTPDVLALYPGPKYLLGAAKPAFYRLLEEVTGPLEGLAKGLTVAQAAFLTLAHYGADPIILVGQDLSYPREGGRTHADGAAFQGRFMPGEDGETKWEDPLRPKGLESINMIEVPANDGGVVPTTHALFSYLKRFEEDIASLGVNVINATEGGARIEGARILSLAQAYESVGLDALPRFDGFSVSHSSPKGVMTTIGERYGEQIKSLGEDLLRLLQEAEGWCTEGSALCLKIHRDLGWKNLNSEETAHRMEPVLECFGRIQKSPRLQIIIDRGVMKALYNLYKSDLPLFEERTPAHHQIMVQRYREFFDDALQMIGRAIQIFESAKTG